MGSQNSFVAQGPYDDGVQGVGGDDGGNGVVGQGGEGRQNVVGGIGVLGRGGNSEGVGFGPFQPSILKDCRKRRALVWA
jgi:hypothetical protein